MNISLNLTLFIQIINFLIAYLFISKVFLKPALKLFEKDKNKKDDLKKQINQKKDTILNKENYKRLSWKKYQEQYQKLIPNPDLKFNKLTFDELHLKEVKEYNKQELEKFVYDISVVLKSKILKGY